MELMEHLTLHTVFTGVTLCAAWFYIRHERRKLQRLLCDDCRDRLANSSWSGAVANIMGPGPRG